MIYYNSDKINDWNFGDDNIIKVYKGVKGAPPTPRLPQGYTEVEYIENTSTAYVNLGVVLYDGVDTSYNIEAKLSSDKPSLSYDNYRYLMSAEEIVAPYYGMAVRWQNVTQGQSITDFNAAANPQNAQWSLLDNGDGTSAFTMYCSATTVDNHTPITIFAGLNGSTPWRNGKGKFYTFKLTKNNELVRDLVPAKRDSDNVVGLYDIVNNEFLVSPNNVDFVAGNVVTPTSSGYTGVVCYYKIVTSGGTTSQTPCYAVVEDISLYEDTEFEDVFNKADEKWYKLNNLNEYEEYGIYGSGRTITTYEGKLTIDDGYEYIYSGGSWVNVGEVSGSTATLPNVPFMLNYNAKNYDATTYTIAKTSGQIKDVDAVCNYGYRIVDHSSDGYITVTGNTRMNLSGTTYLSRNNNQTGCTMTIVSKVKTTSGYSILTNRGSQMNWMWRYPSNGIFLHGSSSYNNPKYFTTTTNNPIVASIKTYYNNGVQQELKDWTNNGSYSGSFAYGAEYNGNSSLFCDYANNNSEFWQGDFYWVYMSQEVLTDEQIQQVIAYNEGGGGQTVYPLYYQEKQDPPQSVSFSSMTEAEEYECPYVGLDADIDGTDYIFDENYDWVTKYGLFEVSGYVCDSGDKYQKMEEKVRNVDDTWSSQDPPVYEKGELIESASTDCGGCRLPNGYTELEYIENTSRAYINLGVKLNQTLGTSYSISTKMYSEYLSSGFGYLIGDEGTSDPYYGMCLRWNAGRFECVFVPTTDGTYVNVPNSDGTSAITISSEGVTQTNNVDLSLFCGIWSSGPWRNGKGRIYTFSLTMNNELVRDLVPAKRDSDSVVGLYDLVNDVFYTSPNGVSFVGGAVVPCGQVDYEKEYLTFRALESGTFKFSGNPISYSTDSGATWTELASNTNSPTIQSGETIMWKASGLTITASTTSENGGMGVFSSSGRYEVEGNIYSIISGDSFTNADTSTIEISQLKNLFNGSTGLTNAENLVMPTTTLNTHSYYGMFKGCTNMVTPPQIPFTTGGDNSCGQMFRNCTSMLIAPAIIATTIQGHTFNSAFMGCSSMTTVPMLAPETLYSASYYSMFSGCTSLNSITCLAKSGINSSNSTYNWVNNVASSGTFYKNQDASWPSGNNGIPSNWTVEDYVS